MPSAYQINEGTKFIILDLEWNQPFPGKEYGIDVSTLRGEIIDIGAEKYTYSCGGLIHEGSFSMQVRPKVYRKLHYHVQKLTHKTNKEIRNGVPFEEAFPEYLSFCGDDYILVCWGNSDPDILKQNMKHYGFDDKIDHPFFDLQPVFSRFAGERGQQRSVEFAVDFYNIPKDDTFHSAWADSHYTGLIFKNMFEHNKASELLAVIGSSLRNPDLVKEFTFVSGETENLDEAYKTAFEFPQICPICKELLKSKIEPFRIRKSVYALYSCKEHGDFFCRTRVKKSKQSKYIAAMVIRFATQSDYYLIADKAEEFKKFGIQGEPKTTPKEDETKM
ncbi:MAG: exonuclease domain-containing protein [Clostridia bacterium]|nr:exonuclease domain-containing protein [Clostridia bacterium]